MSFDPYYEWLGIPPDEQPADHYRLLGVRRFESNLNVVENAAERQLLLLKTFQNGPHGPLTQRMMNEVSAARVCLLDVGKRAKYDAELKGVPSVKAPPRPPEIAAPEIAAPEIGGSGQVEEFDLAAPSAAQPPPVTRERLRDPKPAPRRRKQNVAWASLGIQVAIGGVAAVCVVVVMLWIFWGRDPFNIWQRGADQRDLAQTEGPDVSHQDRESTRRPSKRESIKRPSANNTGSYRGVPQVDEPASPPGPKRRDYVDRNVRKGNEPVSPFQKIDPSSSQQSSMKELQTGDFGTEDTNTLAIVPNDTTNTPGIPEEPQEPLDPFAELLGELDIAQQQSGANTSGIVLGKVYSEEVETWQLDLEDFAAPLGDSQFAVGQPDSQGGTVRWPLLKKSVPESTAPESESEKAADAVPGDQVVAHIQAANQALTLQLVDSPNENILQQLQVCSLNLRAGDHRHTIQFSVPQRMSPLEVSFSDSKQEVVLDNAPALSQVALDRLVFEVVQASVGQESLASNLKADSNKELLITLDADLECQLGMRLVEKDRVFRIVLMPRTTVTGRRDPLVRLEIEKDLARAKSQLLKNRREMVQANNQLNAVPAEVRRVRSVKPGTPQEATMQQRRLSQLEKIGKSLQSKVRRLAEADPKMTKNIEQLDQVLQTINNISGQVTVQYRIYARGNSGDFEVLQATSQLAASLGSRRHFHSVPLLANGR